MNPEIRSRAIYSVDYTALHNKEPKRTPPNPLAERFLESQEKIQKRATWLLDFTDEHPFLYGNASITGENTLEPNGVVFTYEEGRTHRKKWKRIGKRTLSESATLVASYGYEQVKEIVEGLVYTPQRPGYFPQLDMPDPFINFPVKNKLRAVVKEDHELREIVSLITVIAKRPVEDKDHTLAIFATLVGFAQSRTDAIADEKGFSKGLKHTLRDQVFCFAVYRFDRGLGSYLDALNS